MTVVRIVANRVERYEMDLAGNTPDFLTPNEGTVYANCQGALCKWTGKSFEPASEVERRRLDGINHLSAVDFTNIAGWSKRGIGTTSERTEFSVELNSQLTLLVNQGNLSKSIYDSASIDLLSRNELLSEYGPLMGNLTEWERLNMSAPFKSGMHTKQG